MSLPNFKLIFRLRFKLLKIIYRNPPAQGLKQQRATQLAESAAMLFICCHMQIAWLRSEVTLANLF
jgi:hypothetical protein